MAYSDTLYTSGFIDDVVFAHNGSYGGISISLQRRRCSVVRRLTPLLLGVSWVLS